MEQTSFFPGPKSELTTMPPAAIGSIFGSNGLRSFFIFTFFYKSKQKNLTEPAVREKDGSAKRCHSASGLKVDFHVQPKKTEKDFFSAEQVTSRQPVVKGYRNCNHGNHFGGQN